MSIELPPSFPLAPKELQLLKQPLKLLMECPATRKTERRGLNTNPDQRAPGSPTQQHAEMLKQAEDSPASSGEPHVGRARSIKVELSLLTSWMVG